MADPTLIFFRGRPHDWLAQPPLASALQTFETALINLALGRYPTTLVLTVSALESLIKAYRKTAAPQTIGADGKKVRDEYLLKLWEDLAAEKDSKPRTAKFPRESVEKLGWKRNRMVHYGYSPEDDMECVERLLDVGFPLFDAILADCFDFHLGFHSLHPTASTPDELSVTDRAKCGLLLDYASEWTKVFALRSATKDNPSIRSSDCFLGLAHRIRRYIQPTFTSLAEDAMSMHADEIGTKFDQVEKRLSEIKSQFRESWVSDCQYCNEVQCLVLEINFPETPEKVTVSRAACAHCDMIALSAPVARILFRENLRSALPEIIKAYDLTG